MHQVRRLLAFYSEGSLIVASLLFTLSLGCVSSADVNSSPVGADTTLPAAVSDTATFAGGCFWCMEPPYDEVDGVAETTSGYAGGTVPDPSYRQVSSGQTGHAEVVQVVYDSTQVDYGRLLRIYWHNVDPFDGRGQFCDRGSSYRPAIFYHDQDQKEQAETTRLAVEDRFERDAAVQIEPLSAFYAAEAYHQNYYQKNPRRYKRYRTGCGRDERLKEIWGKTAKSDVPVRKPNPTQ